MKEGLYVHVDEVKEALDRYGSRSKDLLLVDEGYILGEVKERAEMYVTPSGKLIRRVR